MKSIAPIFATLLLAMGMSGSALAWHGTPRDGVVIGPYGGLPADGRRAR
jgi:hypothetical protein